MITRSLQKYFLTFTVKIFVFLQCTRLHGLSMIFIIREQTRVEIKAS